MSKMPLNYASGPDFPREEGAWDALFTILLCLPGAVVWAVLIAESFSPAVEDNVHRFSEWWAATVCLAIVTALVSFYLYAYRIPKERKPYHLLNLLINVPGLLLVSVFALYCVFAGCLSVL